MPDKPTVHLTRLLAAVPWKASGPGWSNTGVTAYFEDTLTDGSTRVRTETLQDLQMPAHLDAIRKVGLLVRKELEPLFGGQQGVYRQVEPSPSDTDADGAA